MINQGLSDDRASIVLGAMDFGTTVPEATANAILDRFVELGGRWIDTADCYAFWNDPSGVGGQSEALLGRWLARRPGLRQQLLISTKVRYQPLVPHHWPESAEGLSATAIRNGIRGSLERLGIDHVDLLWAHGEDRSVELRETVETFGQLAAEGTARRLGASNHAAWRVERARAIADSLRLPGWTALQLRHTYVRPRPDTRLPDEGHRLMSPQDLDYASVETGMALWAYSPLLRGSYARPDRPLHEIYDHPGTTRRLGLLKTLADETGATVHQLVLAWLLNNRPAVSPILGVSSVEQLEEAMTAQTLALDPAVILRMNETA
ncbi:MAG: aldo/keto reductase [Kineosporiaceae bacterium]|jgi:aryl-alcohol dehydrogenase-like predicted oxidoreductase